MTEEKNVSETFEAFWSAQDSLPDMEDVGIDILTILTEEFPDVTGKRFLEVGSGSGRISLQLARRGADVCLLDTSESALQLSRSFFRKAGEAGMFVQASGFRLPFATGTFDVVWNSGLIEHFYFDQQVQLLGEMLRVVKQGGTLITFNPSHEGRIYRLGKLVLGLVGRWPYGREIPIKSLAPHCGRLGATLLKEWSTSFDIQFYYFLKFGLPIQRFLRRRAALNRFLGRVLGGYLKVSMIRK